MNLNTMKIPGFRVRPEHAIDLYKDVWLLEPEKGSHRNKVFTKPGFARLFQQFAEIDPQATPFLVSRDVLGEHDYRVPDSRGGVIARNGDNTYTIAVPIATHVGDLRTMADIRVGVPTEQYWSGMNLRQLAGARAIFEILNGDPQRATFSQLEAHGQAGLALDQVTRG